ncbi:MAG TPA: hypothetical protein VGX48_16345 [Pyrinomonadaceae bacterium]|jgi:hypothetical protein|nr:hypothetical protein [Pyrinomonadaceae bacterium]
MSWNNAPRLNKLTAAQQGGNRGAQLWGVDMKGKLYTCYQGSPGGGWSDWGGVGWSDPKEPKAIYELAAAQNQPDGRVYFWALDMKGEMWARWQTSPGGNWSPWQHNFAGLPGPHRPKKLAAVRAGGGQGMVLFAITVNGILHYCYSTTAGAFGGWAYFPNTPEDMRFIEVTACEQKDGRAAVWALDEKRQLWGAGQETPGGKWGPWVGPNWLGAPKLRNIAAVEGMNGAIIVGQDENYRVTSNFQQGAGQNSWRGWETPGQGFDPPSYELAAAGQNNGVAQLWAITLGGKLTTVTQKENNHWNPNWSDKDDDSDLPPPPKPRQK